MRHEVFNRWLDQNQTIDYVLEHLQIAHFDPEFYKTYYNDVLEKFNSENNRDLKLKKKRWSQIFTLKSWYETNKNTRPWPYTRRIRPIYQYFIYGAV